MGFFNLFKKKKEEVLETEVISWEGFDEWLLKKNTEIGERERKIFLESKTRIQDFISELNEQIEVLRKTDLSDRKVEQRVKNIVKENLVNYIIHLKKLEEELEKISNGKNFIGKINSIFRSFEERSKINFAKASFLIREDTNNTKKILKKFLQDIEKIVKDNAEIVHEKIISSIQEKNNEIKNIENGKFEILKAIKEDDIKINNLKENIKIKEKEIEKIKDSPEFLENEKKKKSRLEKEKELGLGIEILKEEIDFKTLAGFYHSFEKEMSLVKECRENFRQIFKRSRENNFVTLLDGANLLNEKISEKIKKIDEIKKDIEEIEIKELGLEKIKRNISEMQDEIKEVVSEKNSKEKKLIQMDEELDSIKKEIEEKLIKMDVKIE